MSFLLDFSERQICREKVGELVAEKIMYVAENMNKHEYIPKMPSQSDLDLVFDTGFNDVQPYLFKVGALTLSNTFKKSGMNFMQTCNSVTFYFMKKLIF